MKSQREIDFDSWLGRHQADYPDGDWQDSGRRPGFDRWLADRRATHPDRRIEVATPVRMGVPPAYEPIFGDLADVVATLRAWAPILGLALIGVGLWMMTGSRK